MKGGGMRLMYFQAFVWLAALAAAAPAGAQIAYEQTGEAEELNNGPAMAQLRQAIDASFRSRSYHSLLLKRKESLDSILTAVLLPSELPRGPHKLCQLLQYAYDGQTLKTEPEAGAISSFWPFLTEPSGRVPSHGSCSLMVARHTPVDSFNPVALSGWVEWTPDSIHWRIDWYEPLLDNHDLEFPNHPEGFSASWDRVCYQSVDQGEPFKTGLDRGALVLTGAMGLYTMVDAVRAANEAKATSVVAPDQRASQDDARPPEQFRTYRPEGVLDRSTSCHFDSRRRLQRVVIQQDSVSLLQHDWMAYNIRGGDRSRPVEYRPSQRLPYLKGGRKITIGFTAQPADDSADADYWVNELTIADAHGAVLTEARYGRPRWNTALPLHPASERQAYEEAHKRLSRTYAALSQQQPDKAPPAFTSQEIRDASSRRIARVMLKHNVYASACQGSMVALGSHLRLYRQLLLDDDLPDVMYLYSLEALLQFTATYGGPNQAMAIARGPLRAAYEQLLPQQAAPLIRRLISQNKLGCALVALDAFQTAHRGSLPAQWIEELRGRIEGLVDQYPNDLSGYPDYKTQAAINQLIAVGLATPEIAEEPAP